MENKVKVAILDTGIDKNHDYLKDNIIGGVSFHCNHHHIFASKKYDDDNGHGTSCSSIIKKEFKNIEIFSVKILDKQGRCNLRVLEEALQYILDTDIKLINLSLSIMNSEMVQDLYNICDTLTKVGKIIVCSLANGFEKSYPAVFDNVIGVRGFILEHENSFWYNKNQKIQCIMDNNPYISCTLNNSYRLFGKCNSQAAAKFTGKIAKILSIHPDISLDQLQEKLELLATKNKWSNEDFKASKRYPNYKKHLYKRDNPHLIETANIVKNILKIDDNDNRLYKYDLFHKDIGLNYDNCFEVIKGLEKSFSTNFEYTGISRYDFASIYTLTELVEKNLNAKE